MSMVLWNSKNNWRGLLWRILSCIKLVIKLTSFWRKAWMVTQKCFSVCSEQNPVVRWAPLGMCIEILPSFFTSHLSTSNLKLNYKRILCIVSKCIFFNKVSLTSFCMIAQNLLEISENRLPGAILKAFHIESYDINNAVKSLLLEISCMKQRREIMFTKKTNPTHPTHPTLKPLITEMCTFIL